MAGIGGYPQVIYLPKDTRWADLGKGIGDLAGGLFDAWNTADATNKAQKIPDLEHRMVYLRSRLGDKSDKYIDDQLTLMKLKDSTTRAQAEATYRQAQMHRWDIQNQVETIKGQYEAQLLQAEIAEKMHRANAGRSAASGSSAKANQQNAAANKSNEEAETVRFKREMIQKQLDMFNQINRDRVPGPGSSIQELQPQHLSGGLGEGGDTGATPQDPGRATRGDLQISGLGLSTPQGGTRGLPQVASIDPSQIAVPAAPDDKGGSTTVPAKAPVEPAAPALIRSQWSGQTPKQMTLDDYDEMEKWYQSGTPIVEPQPGMSPETSAQIQSAIMEGKGSEGFKVMDEVKTKLRDPKELPVGGGYTVLKAMGEDGQLHIVPGATLKRDPRANLTPAEEKSTGGIGAWATYQDQIAKLGDKLDKPIGKGLFDEFMSSQLGRFIDRNLYDMFRTSFNPNTPAYQVARAYSRIGLDSMQSALRETDKLRVLLDYTQPDMADSPAVRKAKLSGARLLADYTVKTQVENLKDQNKVIPRGLREMYRKRGLEEDKTDYEGLAGRYLETITGTGDIPASPGTKAPAASGGDDDLVEIPGGGGAKVPRKYLNQQ